MYPHDMIAFFPFYNEETRDCTRVYLNDGSEQIYNEPIQSFIKNWLDYYHLDISTLQRYAYRRIYRKVHIPIVITHEHFYLPVRMRKTYGKYDHTYGYILRTESHGYEFYWKYLRPEDRLIVESQKTYIRNQELSGLVLAYDYYKYGRDLEFLRRPPNPS